MKATDKEEELAYEKHKHCGYTGTGYHTGLYAY